MTTFSLLGRNKWGQINECLPGHWSYLKNLVSEIPLSSLWFHRESIYLSCCFYLVLWPLKPPCSNNIRLLSFNDFSHQVKNNMETRYRFKHQEFKLLLVIARTRNFLFSLIIFLLLLRKLGLGLLKPKVLKQLCWKLIRQMLIISPCSLI